MAIKWIALWGLISIGTAVLAAVLAGSKNRDHSSWAAWCFVLPPLVIVLALLPTYAGVRRRRPTLDEEDRNSEREAM